MRDGYADRDAVTAISAATVRGTMFSGSFPIAE
jgi:hypothetical protein